VQIEENEVPKNYKPFCTKEQADYKIDPASFLNRTVLGGKRPMSSYSQFSFNKPPQPLLAGVLGTLFLMNIIFLTQTKILPL
jgi:hypothetical protein